MEIVHVLHVLFWHLNSFLLWYSEAVCCKSDVISRQPCAHCFHAKRCHHGPVGCLVQFKWKYTHTVQNIIITIQSIVFLKVMSQSCNNFLLHTVLSFMLLDSNYLFPNKVSLVRWLVPSDRETVYLSQLLFQLFLV